MKRIEFVLSMPNVGSWNGQWTGAERHYSIVKSLRDEQAAPLLKSRSWYYNFGDGWGANIHARQLEKGERRPKSAGFCGYEWMVDSILRHGKILNTPEQKREEAP